MGTPGARPRSFGVGVSSVEPFVSAARDDRALSPRKRSASKSKLDEDVGKLLEADFEERPAATLSRRRGLLRRARDYRLLSLSPY